MKNNYKISVIIPVYNAEKYLKKCLDSVINQTLDDVEIICINDGSTDNSLNILNEYNKKYKNFKLINQENKGVIYTRIKGYKNATGEYIAWLDNDDFLELDMFEKMYSIAKDGDYDIVECNYNFYPKDVKYKEKWFNEYNGVNDWEFTFRNTLLWNKIVKKELLDKINFPYIFEHFGEGSYSLVLISTNKISTINEPLYNYRVGHQSLSHNYSNIDWYKKITDCANERYDYVVKNNYENKWLELFKFTYLYYVLVLMIVACYNDNKELYYDCKKIIKNDELFSNKYKKYLKKHLSLSKYLFSKYVCLYNYNLAKIIAKKVLN